MGEGRAGWVGGPEGGSVGRAEAVKEGGDATGVSDVSSELVPEGSARCRVREVAEECQWYGHRGTVLGGREGRGDTGEAVDPPPELLLGDP